MKARPETGLRLQGPWPGRSVPPGDLEAALAAFDWFYLGAEFCENLLPRPDQCAALAAKLLGAGGKVCLLTPPLSERGLRELRPLLRKFAPLAKRFPGKVEITLNDFGAAAEASRLCPGAALAAGRLLHENIFFMNRGGLKLLGRQALDFFSDIGIRRFEISLAGKLPRTDLREAARAADLSITLHYPYFNLTGARACTAGMPDIAPDKAVRGIVCRRECLACSFEVDYPAIKEKLYLSGNTLSLKFPGNPLGSAKALAEKRIDRLVYAPYP